MGDWRADRHSVAWRACADIVQPVPLGKFCTSDTGAAITQAEFAIFQPGKRAFAINPR